MGLSVAAGLLAGVCVVQVFPALPPIWVGLTLTIAAALAFLRFARARVIFACALGVAWACAVGQGVMTSRLPVSEDGSDAVLEGSISGLPIQEPDSVRFDFRIDGGNQAVLVGRTVRLGWYGAPPQCVPGSRWHLVARLKRPRGVLNPGGYDFEKSALVQRLAAIGYVREPSLARPLSGGQGIDSWRDRIADQIERALPGGRARFVRALAIGDTRTLTDADWETLRATGLTHQIAISGFHVGMVAGFGALLAGGLFRLFPRWARHLPRPQATALAALVFAAAYTALAGFALPTVRTLLMIAAVLLARLLRRPQSGADAFALATIAVLLFDPLSVLTPGFWLSFAGVAWLLWCLPHERATNWLRPFLEAQGVSVLGLLPLTVWFFGQASLPGPLANLIGIPVISLIVVPLSLVGLALAPVSTAASGLLWHASAWVMEQLWWLLEQMAHWPAATVWFPEPGLIALVLALTASFWLLLPRATPAKGLALLLLLPLLWPDRHSPATGEVEIDVIDVGQGLSVLVQTEHHALLFDTGPASARGLDMGEAAVLPALRALSVGRLDWLIISHGDNDHAGGLPALRRAFPNTPVLAPDGWAKTGMGRCEANQRWTIDGVELRFLHPPPLFPYLTNDSSCVLRIAARGHVILLPGDIGRHVEARLVREQASLLKADLLLAPHHGSASSSTDAFVAAVRPAGVVFATGAGNRFGHPSADVVQRYLRAQAQAYDTAQTGALRFHLDGKGIKLVTSRRQDERRYWRERSGTRTGYAISRPDSER